MDVLVELAKAQGRVVERDELLRIWGPRAVVADEALTRCIAELRKALGDSPREPVYIKTIPVRGYRLLVEATPLAPAESQPATRPATPWPAPSPPPPAPDVPVPLVRDGAGAAAPGPVTAAQAITHAPAPPRWGLRWSSPLQRWFVVISLLLVVALLEVGIKSKGSRKSVDLAIGENTIAVQPFDDASDRDFGEGLADEIRTRLNSVSGLFVIARDSSSHRTRGFKDDVQAIGERLHVARVLRGTVHRSGEHQVRIYAELADTQRGITSWSDSIEGPDTDLPALQDGIATKVVDGMRRSVSAPLGKPVALRAPRDPLAYELLVRGRVFRNRRDENSLRHAIELFQQAIEREPTYGIAYLDLAKAYVVLPAYSAEVPEEMFDLATSTLAKGAQYDPTVYQLGQGVLALVAAAHWEWVDAQFRFNNALARSDTDPDLSDLLVWYSEFLASVGRIEDSTQIARRALEKDPNSAAVNHRLSASLMWADRDEDAEHYAAAAKDYGLGPDVEPDAYIILRIRQRDYDAVRPMLIGGQMVIPQSTEWADPLLAALKSPGDKVAAAAAIAALAKAEQARDIYRKFLFAAWVYLGESDRAVTAGLQLVNDRPSFKTEFLFSREASKLRANPRFGELVRETNLNRYWDQYGWPKFCKSDGGQIVCH